MYVLVPHNKKKKYDFVFVCESKVRELENICLIAHELEKRGYSTAVVNWWLRQVRKDYSPVDAKVLMAHAVYKDDSLNRELYYVKGPSHVINLQWEQVYSRGEIASETSPWKMMGEVKNVMHLSWGVDNYNKLIEYDGIDTDNIRITGSVAMDTLRPEFTNYYLSREEVLSRYNIPIVKKICLFVSSFSLVNLPEISQEDDFKELWSLMIKSQKIVLDWMDRLLNERKDIVMVYRPHPAEADNILIQEMVKKHDNFLCIGELSVKQWIVISDVIYNWYSTSIAEMYFAGKSCYIIRPVPIPAEIEVITLENGRHIHTYDEFRDSLDAEDVEFPVPTDKMKSVYSNYGKTPSYMRVADVCEEVYRSSRLKFKTSIQNNYLKRLYYWLKVTALGKVLLNIKHMCDEHKPMTEDRIRANEYEKYVQEMFLKNDFDQNEVDSIMDRICYTLK